MTATLTGTAPANAGCVPGTSPGSRTATRCSWMLTGLVSVFLLLDAAAKLARVQPVLDSFGELGWPEHLVLPVGLLLLGCVVLHLVPRTSIVGAVLLSAYLGGAVAANLRVEAPLLSTVLFPVYLAGAVWLALFLRDSRVRALSALADPAG